MSSCKICLFYGTARENIDRTTDTTVVSVHFDNSQLNLHVAQNPCDYVHSMMFILYCRYAHSSVVISGDRIVCIGGFGIDDHHCHRRLCDVLVVSVDADHCSTNTLRTSGSGPGMKKFESE